MYRTNRSADKSKKSQTVAAFKLNQAFTNLSSGEGKFAPFIV